MRFVRACCWPTIVALTMVCVVGCSAEAQRYIRFPNLIHPGPAAVQRAEAIQHDPYPLNDIGPEIVGGRPLAYQQPLTEVDRARLLPSRPVVLQPAPVPGATVFAPPVGSSPFAVAPAQPGAPLAPAPMAPSAQPMPGPPVVTSAIPAAPAPVAAPYSVPPAPVITSPYPAAAAPPAGPLPLQPRAPY